MHNEWTQGNLQSLNASTSQPMESTVHNVNHPSSSASEEENRERREKATQAEPASVYEDTTSGRVLVDVQEEISTPRVGDQVKFNVINALNDTDHFQFCLTNADINEKTKTMNATLRNEILKVGEDGEDDEINLFSDRQLEKSEWSNRFAAKIEPLLKEPSTHELQTRPTHLNCARLREVIMYFIVASALNPDRDKGSQV